MNFKRIQGIFLLAFIVIDVFLFSMIIHNQNMQSANITTTSANATIVKEMKRDEISVGKTSTQKGYGYYISAMNNNTLQNNIRNLKNQSASYLNNSVISTFQNEPRIDPQNPQRILNGLMNNNSFIADGKDYVYDREASTTTKVVYNQKVLGSQFLTSGGRITFDIEGKYLKGYTQTGLRNVKILHEKARTISGQRALIWLYQYNEIPNNTQITSERMGYSKLLDIKGNDVYIPTWVVAMKNKNTGTITTKRINAFTGSVLKTEKFQEAPEANAPGGTEAN